MHSIYAQGDVLIIQTEDNITASTPVACDPDGALVLARGEVTGHRHMFFGSPHVAMFRDDALARDIPADLYIGHVRISEAPALLLHEEHDSLELEPGVYEIRRQREYPAREGRRVVAD